MTEQSNNLQLAALGACGGGAPRQPAMLRCARAGATALPRAGTAPPRAGTAPLPHWGHPGLPVPCWGLGCCPFVSHVPSPEHLCPSAGATRDRDRDRVTGTVQHTRVPAAVPRPVPGSGCLAPAAPRAASTLISLLSEISWCGFHVRWDTYEISGLCVFF